MINFDLVNLFLIMSSIRTGDSSFPYASLHVKIAIPSSHVYKESSILTINYESVRYFGGSLINS